MDKLENALHMMKKNLIRLRERNTNESFVKGYEKAIKDITWLKGKVDEQDEKSIEDYFNVDQRTAKIKRNANRA